jgi:membrane protease YdiL (CAAX protease family)
MKCCDYCGKENEEALAYCAGCGLDLNASVSAPLQVSVPRVLNGKYATIILGVFLAAHVVGYVSAALVGAILGAGGSDNGLGALHTIAPVMLLAGQIFGAIAVLWITPRLGFRTGDTRPTGAAWVWGSWRNIAEGLMTGVLVYLVVFIVLSACGSPRSHHEMGYLKRMTVTPGFPRIAAVISALLFAPTIEELLFRGVLYGGYRKSLGPLGAAVITTSVFALLHVPNAPIEVICIAGGALANLWMRLRSRAIGPAIACHFSYNAVVILCVLWWFR